MPYISNYKRIQTESGEYRKYNKFMQAYGPGFARVYNLLWAGFARQVAPRILEYYERAPLGHANKTLLDLACGTGQLALYFLEHGYQVTGLDLSEDMLRLARENAVTYLVAGEARFGLGDARNFRLEQPVGLAVSTFDALNHLESLEALQACFRCVHSAVVEGGLFIFDLNTRAGLRRWNSINVEEGEEAVVITRGIYDGHSDRAYTRVSGFVRLEDGRYERFEETVFNTVFEMQAVKRALIEAGWRDIHAATVQDLATPLEAPEAVGRAFFVARK